MLSGPRRPIRYRRRVARMLGAGRTELSGPQLRPTLPNRVLPWDITMSRSRQPGGSSRPCAPARARGEALPHSSCCSYPATSRPRAAPYIQRPGGRTRWVISTRPVSGPESTSCSPSGYQLRLRRGLDIGNLNWRDRAFARTRGRAPEPRMCRSPSRERSLLPHRADHRQSFMGYASVLRGTGG
jgi:hypothetical protein